MNSITNALHALNNSLFDEIINLEKENTKLKAHPLETMIPSLETELHNLKIDLEHWKKRACKLALEKAVDSPFTYGQLKQYWREKKIISATKLLRNKASTEDCFCPLKIAKEYTDYLWEEFDKEDDIPF